MKKPSKKLLSEWYRKAKKAGFEDIEQNDAQERLKKWHSFYYQARYTPDKFTAVEDYYRLATDLVEHGEFETGKHKKIWTLHAEGLTVTEIAKAVRATEYAVHSVIVRYRKNFCR